MILLDTDVCLMLLKGNKKILQSYCALPEDIVVSEITVYELFMLANGSSDPVSNKITVEKFLLTVRVLHPDLEVLKLAADLQYAQKRKGLLVVFQDMLMYCLSKRYGARLITTDASRYRFT
jgi:predicted nucleic acid-binding protein